MMIWGWLFLIPFAALCYLQNAAYTWSSKTRAKGTDNEHRVASWFSNGAYYIGNAVLTIYTVRYLEGNPLLLVASLLIYCLATSEGSVMMKRVFAKKDSAEPPVPARVAADQEIKSDILANCQICGEFRGHGHDCVKFVQFTLRFTVRKGEEFSIENEIEQALDLISQEHDVFDEEVSHAPTKVPEGAVD